MPTSINLTQDQRKSLEEIRARKSADLGTKLNFKNIIDLAIKLFIDENSLDKKSE